MAGRGRSAHNFGTWMFVGALAAALALGSGCDVDHTNMPHLATFAPTIDVVPFVSTSILPQAVVVVPVFGVGCPAFPSLATNFDLVISVSGKTDQFLRETTFRLLDGTHRGETPLLVSTADLEGKFGPTLIHAGSSRTFAFSPRFGCGTFVPASLSADVVLMDAFGNRHGTTIVVPIRGEN